MRRVFMLVLGLALLMHGAAAQYTTISGNLATPSGPNSGTFSGSIIVSLARSTVTNTCSTPVQIVPFAQIVIPVTNGVVPVTALLATDCMAPHLAYAIIVKDSSGGTVYTDNWYIPQTTSATVDVGSLSTVLLAPAIAVSVPVAIVSTPQGTQTITQPGGTFFNVNNLAVTGTFTSASAAAFSITGNAATATALAANPANCSAGQFSTGIQANGTADCSSSFPAAAFSQTYIQITGNTASSFPSQGAYIVWNQTCCVGTTDFVNQRGGGSGGFRFYNATGAGTLGPIIAFIDAAGNYGGTGAITFEGNAQTATQFFATPSVCPAGQLALGVNRFGNAICTGTAGQLVQHARATGCSTPSGTYSTCITAVNWPTPFASTSYDVSCIGIGPSDARAALNGIVNQFTNGVNVRTVTEGSLAVSYSVISCVASL